MKTKTKDDELKKMLILLQKREGYFFIAGFVAGLIFGAMPAMWIAVGIAILGYFWFKKKDKLKQVLDESSKTNS